MKGIKKLYLMLILFMVSTLQMMAQQKITGRVIDDDGFAVPYASVQYKATRSACLVMEKVSSPSRSILHGCSP